jgi:hypothetical protein
LARNVLAGLIYFGPNFPSKISASKNIFDRLCKKTVEQILIREPTTKILARSACEQRVNIAWEKCGRFVKTSTENFLNSESQGFFRTIAKNSTAHSAPKMQLAFAFRHFSTNPQRSSQQQGFLF